MAEFFFLLLVLAGAGLAVSLDECAPVGCGDDGLAIRFPFWLRDRQPETCGYPGFELTCPRINDTEFEFQFPVRASTGNLQNIVLPVSLQASVLEIDYKPQLLQVAVLNASCLPKQLPDMNSSSNLTYPFEEFDSYLDDAFTLFNCSSNYTKQYLNYGSMVTCLSGHGYDVFAFSSFSYVYDLPLASCSKMYDISDVPTGVFNQHQEHGSNQVSLHWSKPSCGICEAQGQHCRLENNSTSGQPTYCFGVPGQQPNQRHSRGISRQALATGLAIGVSLILLIITPLIGFIYLKRKKEDQKKVGNFMQGYKAHRPTRFSYADIKKMTCQFREKLGQGSFGTTYKGKLVNDIVVAVKVLSNSGRRDSEEFVGQLLKMNGIQHKNVVRLVGYCADGKRRALVFEFLRNDSLEKFMSSGKQNKPLNWEELQKIAIGVAQGIDYLHHGCNQQLLHLDIKPRNVLLDHNYNPRLTDFSLVQLCSKEQIILSMDAEQTAMEYIPPEVLSSNFGNASSKSDVYSFGILLFEIVRRMKIHHNIAEPSSQFYLPEWMYNQMDRREEIALQIDGEEDNKIERKLMAVGLWCTLASMESAFFESSDSDARRRGHACCPSKSILSNRIKLAQCSLVL